MSAILGLTSTKTFADNNFHKRNNRRKIFHDFPVGAFPLTGLLSLMDTEETDSTEFGWFEKRYTPVRTTLDAPGSVAPFSATGSDTAASSPATLTAGTIYRIKVVDSSNFRFRQQIWIRDVPSSSGYVQVKGVITSIPSATRIEIQVAATVVVLNTTTANTNGTGGPVGSEVVVIGTAAAEGATSSGDGVIYTPCNPTNYTQIFRDSMTFTRSALKQPTEFDKTGIYKEKAQDVLLEHMTQMEKAFLFGVKRVDNVTEGADTVQRRQTGGITYFLEQYEAADSIYRGGTGAAALTANSDDDKRIITAASNTIAWTDFNKYMERAFRVTNNKAFEKLFLCGSGFLAAVNAALEQKAVLNKDFGVQKVYGMNVITWETPFGVVHFKTHPLFSRDSYLRFNGLLLDVQNLKYRALSDSDTTLLKDRQANDYDGRKDEWITEAGLEVNFPESNMYFRNMQTLNPSA